MNKSLLCIFVFAVILFSACSEKEITTTEDIIENEVNPAHADFDLLHSDEKAIEIADKVMKSIGGRENWDNTKYLRWNFFGKRLHYWNKETGDVRIEIPSSDAIILMNINTLEGKVKLGDVEPTKADSLDKYLDLGKDILSVRKRAELLSVNRSSLYYRPRNLGAISNLRNEIHDLRQKYQFFGYRRIAAFLSQEKDIA